MDKRRQISSKFDDVSFAFDGWFDHKSFENVQHFKSKLYRLRDQSKCNYKYFRVDCIHEVNN